MVLSFARRAANIFSLMPPTGSTFPRSVISPVIATLRLTGVFGQNGYHGHGHGDTGGGAVFGNRPFGNVNVEIVFGKDILFDLELASPGARVGKSRLGGLLHDFTELAGENQIALSLHDGCFDEENVPAGGSPGHTCGDTDLIILENLLGQNLGRA